MKITVECEFDLEAWNKEHGEGSAWFAKYGPGQERTRDQLIAALREVLEEGFYDWNNGEVGGKQREWLKITTR